MHAIVVVIPDAAAAAVVVAVVVVVVVRKTNLYKYLSKSGNVAHINKKENRYTYET